MLDILRPVVEPLWMLAEVLGDFFPIGKMNADGTWEMPGPLEVGLFAVGCVVALMVIWCCQPQPETSKKMTPEQIREILTKQ